LFLFSFLQPAEIFVDDESKLTLHGLQQYYVKLTSVTETQPASGPRSVLLLFVSIRF